jgi:hypothetical protein
MLCDVKEALPQCRSLTERHAHTKPAIAGILFLHFPRAYSIVCAMNTPVEFRRRLGPDPHANGAKTYAVHGCPDILELDGGDFAIIGSDITAEAAGKLPPSASCGPDERIIRIPRRTLVLAKPDIPEKL